MQRFKVERVRAAVARSTMVVSMAWAAAVCSQPVAPGPLIDSTKLFKLSEHVYVIPDEGRRYIPNVGIVVGQRATLVIDPGLGVRNGEIVLAEARKLGEGKPLYVAATHHHPEHDLGTQAFPANAPLLRSRAQQQDVDEFGLTQAQTFAKRAPELAALIAGCQDRRADVLFDQEYTLDLGGVRVRMYAAGPAHTRGDTIFYVEQDRVLFGGDLAMQRTPKLMSPSSGVNVWFDALKRLRRFEFDKLVPSHGPLGDQAMVDATEHYLRTVQSRTRELKTQGLTLEQATERLAKEIAPLYPNWPDATVDYVGPAVKAAYTEAR